MNRPPGHGSEALPRGLKRLRRENGCWTPLRDGFGRRSWRWSAARSAPQTPGAALGAGPPKHAINTPRGPLPHVRVPAPRGPLMGGSGIVVAKSVLTLSGQPHIQLLYFFQKKCLWTWVWKCLWLCLRLCLWLCLWKWAWSVLTITKKQGFFIYNGGSIRQTVAMLNVKKKT